MKTSNRHRRCYGKVHGFRLVRVAELDAMLPAILDNAFKGEL